MTTRYPRQAAPAAAKVATTSATEKPETSLPGFGEVLEILGEIYAVARPSIAPEDRERIDALFEKVK